ARSQTCWMSGLPCTSASALPGKRTEAKRAGMTATVRVIRVRPHPRPLPPDPTAFGRWRDEGGRPASPTPHAIGVERRSTRTSAWARRSDLAHLGGAEEHVVGVQEGQHETPPAVQEPRPPEVHREEPPGRPEEEVGQAAAASGGRQLPGSQLGVAVGPSDEVLDAAVALVVERRPEPAHWPVHADGLVDGARREAPATAAEEPQLVVGVPAAVADPRPLAEVPARNQVADVARS